MYKVEYPPPLRGRGKYQFGRGRKSSRVEGKGKGKVKRKAKGREWKGRREKERQREGKGKGKGKEKGKWREGLIFFPRERVKGGKEGLIFFPRGREGGGELKKERRLDFFPANLKHAFSLSLFLFEEINRDLGFFFDFFSVVPSENSEKKGSENVPILFRIFKKICARGKSPL